MAWFMGKINFWLHNARHISLPQSLLPAFTAVAVGAASGHFSWSAAVLSVIGIAAAHLGMNLADDWFDYKVHSGEIRQKHASEGIRARMVKYPYLTSGEATTGQLLAVTFLLLGIAACCGIAVAVMEGWGVMWFALAGFLLGMSYSGGPLRLGFRGLGELVIFLMFGPMLMTGTYFAVCGGISPEIIWISCAVGLLVANIVYSHSIMDAEHDLKAGKYTMAHLMGSRRGQLGLSGFINFAPYLLIAAGVCLKQLHPAYLAVFLTLPLSIWLVGSLRDFVYEKPVEIVIKPWMGPIGNFDGYRKAGIDWFMLRWLAARNIVTFFCLIIIVASIILSVL